MEVQTGHTAACLSGGRRILASREVNHARMPIVAGPTQLMPHCSPAAELRRRSAIGALRIRYAPWLDLRGVGGDVEREVEVRTVPGFGSRSFESATALLDARD